MASEIQAADGTGAGAKKGLYKELRQNPYLLGLSAVRLQVHVLMAYQHSNKA